MPRPAQGCIHDEPASIEGGKEASDHTVCENRLVFHCSDIFLPAQHAHRAPDNTY